jgi:hypothetical protein
LLGQIKNNLTAKVMITHRYHMETEIVGYDTEAQKDIKASKVFIHGLIAQNVEDIVLEQEKAKKSARTQGVKPSVGWWGSSPTKVRSRRTRLCLLAARLATHVPPSTAPRTNSETEC